MIDTVLVARVRGRVLPWIALLGIAAPSAGQCTMSWGHSPTLECLWHAEFAKEGLAVDKQQRSFSVGFGQPGGSFAPKQAVLQVRDAAGAKLSQNLYGNGAFDAFYAGVWTPKNGSAAFAVGSQWVGATTELIVSRWLPGGGTPWTTLVNAQTVAFSAGALGLIGTEAWGCRIVRASATDLFISGCTEFEIFLARIDKATLSLVASWGVFGVQSVASVQVNGCPKHDSPGAFVDFLFYPWSFVEKAGNKVYLGGTLLNDLTGVPTDYDYVVAGFNAQTGAPSAFGVQYSLHPGDDYMHALAATSASVYAVGTHDPFAFPQMELVTWETNGLLRPPFHLLAPTPSRGNDVEVRKVSARLHSDVYVGGYGTAGSLNGAIWHLRHVNAPGAPVFLLPQWNGGSGGANPKQYGSVPTDEVFDIALGRSDPIGHEVFAAGELRLSPGNWGQNLRCVATNGALGLSNNATPSAPSDDHATAVWYDKLSVSVFTHGTAFDPGSWLSCPSHWAYRSSRYQP